MDLTEINEAVLEKQIHSLAHEVEKRTKHFTAKDISAFSGTIPYMKTMLEYRTQRDSFLEKIEKMQHTFKRNFYVDEYLEKCDKAFKVSQETGQSLINFFQKEIERVTILRKTVISNFSLIEITTENENAFEYYMTDVSKALKNYNLCITRILAKSTNSYSIDDFMVMIRSKYLNHFRKMLLKTLFLEFKHFPLSRRYSIIKDAFQMTENDLLQNGTQSSPRVPIFLTNIEQLDVELSRLASKFGIPTDFNSEDGQIFLYHCDKGYNTYYTKLWSIERSRTNPPAVGPHVSKSLYTLTDEEIYKKTPIDEDVEYILKLFVEDNERKIDQYIKDQVHNYNQMVGIKINQVFSNGFLKRKKILPNDRLTSWFKLRHLYSRYLIEAITSYYNYFEAIKQNLFGKKYKWEQSTEFPDLINVIDIETGKPVLFQSAQQAFSDLHSTMLYVISYFTLKFESSQQKSSDEKVQLADKGTLIERFFELEIQYINAKRSLIQRLYDINNHNHSEETIKVIFGIIAERPKYHVTLYNSFEIPYKIAIKIMEKRASLISLFYHVQILHERQIAARLPSSIPIFDRSVLLKCSNHSKLFHESFPLSPFEIYPFVTFITKFIKEAEEIALDISESVGFRQIQFFDYMHLAVLTKMIETVSTFTSKGFFPFEIKYYPFQCELSECAYSLIVSPFINDINYINDLIQAIPQAKQLRFLISYIKFLEVSWTIQKLIISSDILQRVYANQASLAAISDPRIYMQAFREIVDNETIDSNAQATNESLLDFALVDYQSIDINFNDKNQVARFILENPFSLLQRALQFQRLHCFMLDIAGRYNSFYLDNSFMISHFGLDSDFDIEEEEDVDLFLTQQTEAHDQDEIGDGNDVIEKIEALSKTSEGGKSNNSFLKSFLIGTLLFDSQLILENQQKAKAKREFIFLNIRAFKTSIRSIIHKEAKLKRMSDDELYKLYYSEIIDSFTAYAYRVEIANICKLERCTLLLNTYSDAFILESSNMVLVNEAGRVQNHFVVPTWIDTLCLVRTATLSRQTAIFRYVLDHVALLYQILNIVRFEVTLAQPIDKVLDDLWQNCLTIDTSIIQKLLNELNRLPNGNEFDVSSTYLEKKLNFLTQRLELALFLAYDLSFISVNSDSKLGTSSLNLHEQMTSPMNYITGLFTSHRFIPEWMDQFMGECSESIRNEISGQLLSLDKKLDKLLTKNQLHSILESAQAMTATTDFLTIALHHERLKFSMFLLQSGHEDSTIEDPFTFISKTEYLDGLTEWDEKVLKNASRIISSRNEMRHTDEKEINEVILMESEIEVTKGICDEIMLNLQIEEVKKITHLVTDHFSKFVGTIKEDPPVFVNRPNLEDPAEMNSLFTSHLNTCKYLITKKLKRGLKQITKNLMISSERLEDFLSSLTRTIMFFTNQSVLRIPQAWHFIIEPYIKANFIEAENASLLELYNTNSIRRYDDLLKADTVIHLKDSLLEINRLDQLIYQRKHEITGEDFLHHKLISDEYDKLVVDLIKEKQNLKQVFKKQKESTYDLVVKRINAAGETIFDTSMVNYTGDYTLRMGNTETIRETEIEQLRKDALKMRIVRCIASISSQRYFTKRILSYENDRIVERSKLWEAKKEFEVTRRQMVENLNKAYRRLADYDIDIEVLRQQLDASKQTTIKLVQWKALNAKKEDELENELKKYEKVDPNTGDLLNRLAKAKKTLNRLKQETDGMRLEKEREITTGIRKVDMLRKKILTAKIHRNDAYKAAASGKRPQTAASVSIAANDLEGAIAASQKALIAQYRDDNIQLMSRNDHLQQQIEALESTRKTLSSQTISYISDVLPAPKPTPIRERGRPTPQRRGTPITRPRTATTPRKPGTLDQILKTTLYS